VDDVVVCSYAIGMAAEAAENRESIPLVSTPAPTANLGFRSRVKVKVMTDPPIRSHFSWFAPVLRIRSSDRRHFFPT
jgi:hypothetical protein